MYFIFCQKVNMINNIECEYKSKSPSALENIYVCNEATLHLVPRYHAELLMKTKDPLEIADVTVGVYQRLEESRKLFKPEEQLKIRFSHDKGPDKPIISGFTMTCKDKSITLVYEP